MKKYPTPKKFDYNLIVIGAGSAGLVSSYIAATMKAKVLLVEKHKMGGDCLNTGCVPSKALIASAKFIHQARNAQKYAIDLVNIEYSFAKIMERVRGIIKKIEPHDSIERYQELGVECITASAEIISPYQVKVGEEVFSTRSIIIATGARPFVPNFVGLDQIEYLTSDNVWELNELPRKLVILGGGPIGSELTQCFARLGSNVTQIASSDRLLPKEDADVGSFVLEKFKEEGVLVLTEHKAIRIEKDGERKFVICKHLDQEVKVEFDQLLIALGRKANVTGFGLEGLDVELTAHGTIQTDTFLRTNYPNIYAAGDVAGPYQFTHFAAHQAWYASINALLSPFKTFKANYQVIPWCTYLDPEVARVGLSEDEARKNGIGYIVTKYNLSELDRAITDSKDSGFVKVLTTKRGGKILGAVIVGEHAGDLITEFVTAMKYGLSLNKILGTIHIYPTFAESNKYVAGEWKRQNTAKFLFGILKAFNAWRIS